ncbi:MAG: thioredoxin family protein [Candidatus Marinimicrobia bacterium]|nr:thioredoxin family protein [Candidatus Neomarinimicrobiota bacterium]MCF7904452.1 thioredoxin family protein [Candidatus Neomarinimicrobiota bacterium]
MLITGLLCSMLLSIACSDDAPKVSGETLKSVHKITFVELGSVNCIPCKKMQPVMAAIEAKYGDQIDVVFYDVWEEDQKQYARDYGIRLIPTQVFLDSSGTEIFRHEGFYPESEINAFLASKGLIALPQAE